MSLRPRRQSPTSLGLASAFAVLVFSTLGLAADQSPIDKASSQVSEALSVLKDVKLGNKDGDEHLEKARTYLARARAELLKTQGQSSSE